VHGYQCENSNYLNWDLNTNTGLPCIYFAWMSLTAENCSTRRLSQCFFTKRKLELNSTSDNAGKEMHGFEVFLQRSSASLVFWGVLKIGQSL
jgi:hypothetical protein